MKLTPLDIRQQQFRKSLWGLDAAEVHAFLDVVANDFESLIRRSHSHRDDLARREAEIKDYRERERSLKDTMITATRIIDDIKQNARKEAELVIAEAETQAEQIIRNAHTRLVRIVEDIDELRRQKAQFEATLRSTLSAHGKLLDTMNERDAPYEAEMLPLLQRRAGRRSGDAQVVDLSESIPEQAVVVEPELLTPRGGDR